MRWSVRHPYAVDLRSARATPAPPVVMVGYSARLALTTTLTGLVFEVATSVGGRCCGAAVPAWSLASWRTAGWPTRHPSGVVATVAS